MAERSVNPQVTDAAAQVAVQVLGEAPAMAMGLLMQATAQAMANAAHNATAAQQNANMIQQAATVQGVALIYGARGRAAMLAAAKLVAARRKG